MFDIRNLKVPMQQINVKFLKCIFLKVCRVKISESSKHINITDKFQGHEQRYTEDVVDGDAVQ